MRELKVRAWDTGAKCYVELDNLRGERSIYFSPYDLGAIPPEVRDRVVLEQYTELKDKNGKEIYEGDIIDDGVSHIGKVLFNQIILAYVFEYEVDDNIIGSTFIELYTRDIEVIGNIHENPELLEEEE